MRISDWSSDVCSSDLIRAAAVKLDAVQRAALGLDPFTGNAISPQAVLEQLPRGGGGPVDLGPMSGDQCRRHIMRRDRKSVGEGKRVAVREDRGGRRYIKKKKQARKKTEEIESK